MTDNTDIDNGWRERFIQGGWIPPDRKALKEWLKPKSPNAPKIPYLHPAVQELKHLIDKDPEIHMGFHEMLVQKAAEPVGPNLGEKFWAVNWLLDFRHPEYVRLAQRCHYQSSRME